MFLSGIHEICRRILINLTISLDADKSDKGQDLINLTFSNETTFYMWKTQGELHREVGNIVDFLGN